MTETTTLNLTDFLLARIAEDEEGAWEIHNQHDCDDRFPCVCGVPDRIKVECEAKRQIVALHKAYTWGPQWPEAGVVCASCNTPFEPVMPDRAGVSEMVRHPCDTLLALALPYADHPDYRAEWRP